MVPPLAFPVASVSAPEFLFEEVFSPVKTLTDPVSPPAVEDDEMDTAPDFASDAPPLPLRISINPPPVLPEPAVRLTGPPIPVASTLPADTSAKPPVAPNFVDVPTLIVMDPPAAPVAMPDAIVTVPLPEAADAPVESTKPPLAPVDVASAVPRFIVPLGPVPAPVRMVIPPPSPVPPPLLPASSDMEPPFMFAVLALPEVSVMTFPCADVVAPTERCTAPAELLVDGPDAKTTAPLAPLVA